MVDQLEVYQRESRKETARKRALEIKANRKMEASKKKTMKESLAKSTMGRRRAFRETLHMPKGASSDVIQGKQTSLNQSSQVAREINMQQKQPQAQVCVWGQRSVSRFTAMYYLKCQVFNKKNDQTYKKMEKQV